MSASRGLSADNIFVFANYFVDIILFLAVYFEKKAPRRLFYVGIPPTFPFFIHFFLRGGCKLGAGERYRC